MITSLQAAAVIRRRARFARAAAQGLPLPLPSGDRAARLDRAHPAARLHVADRRRCAGKRGPACVPANGRPRQRQRADAHAAPAHLAADLDARSMDRRAAGGELRMAGRIPPADVPVRPRRHVRAPPRVSGPRRIRRHVRRLGSRHLVRLAQRVARGRRAGRRAPARSARRAPGGSCRPLHRARASPIALRSLFQTHARSRAVNSQRKLDETPIPDDRGRFGRHCPDGAERMRHQQLARLRSRGVAAQHGRRRRDDDGGSVRQRARLQGAGREGEGHPGLSARGRWRRDPRRRIRPRSAERRRPHRRQLQGDQHLARASRPACSRSRWC